MCVCVPFEDDSVALSRCWLVPGEISFSKWVSHLSKVRPFLVHRFVSRFMSHFSPVSHTFSRSLRNVVHCRKNVSKQIRTGRQTGMKFSSKLIQSSQVVSKLRSAWPRSSFCYIVCPPGIVEAMLTLRLQMMIVKGKSYNFLEWI